MPPTPPNGATTSDKGIGTTGPQDGAGSGVEYAAFFQRLVDQQDARKTSIEQRGISVITTSGALVTLLFGIVTLVTKDPAFRLPASAIIPLGVALGAFVLASVLGLLANIPSKKYFNVDGDQVQKLLDYMTEPPEKARTRLAATNLRVFRAAQDANEGKALILRFGMMAEVAAVAALSIGVLIVLAAAS